MGFQYTFKRTEKKYLLSADQFREISTALRPRMREDRFGLHTISSIYYDTPDFLLIRTSLEHPVYKEKLRLRGYDDTDLCFPEIKKKYRGVVYKRRIACKPEEWPQLLGGAVVQGQSEQIQQELRQMFHLYPGFAPRVYIAYDRLACIGNENEELRITFDHRIRTRTDRLDLRQSGVNKLLLPESSVVMEIKFSGGAPLWLARLLSDCAVYPTSFSKYGTWYAQHVGGQMPEKGCQAAIS